MITKICVIIVTYNGERTIQRCIESLLNSNVPFNVIIIDNNSTDSTCHILSQYETSPFFYIIHNVTNVGFGKANNQGIRWGLTIGADYFFLLNQDVYIQKETLSKLQMVIDSNEDIGIVSPIQMNGEGTHVDRAFVSLYKKLGLATDSQLDCSKLYYSIQIPAASWFVTRKCFEIVGIFNPIFPHYGEDSDFARRTEYHRLKMCFTPLSCVCHDRPQFISFSCYNSYISFLYHAIDYHSSFSASYINAFWGYIKKAYENKAFKDFLFWKYLLMILCKPLRLYFNKRNSCSRGAFL